MPVTNRPVALIQQSVKGNLVGAEVGPHLLEGPGGKRVQLEETSAGLNLEDVEVGAITLLGPTTTRDDSLGSQLLVGATTRFDLDKVIVREVISLPELLAVLGLEVGGGLTVEWLVDLEGDVVMILDLLGQIQRFLEMVQGVNEDQRHRVALSVVARLFEVMITVVALIFGGRGGSRGGVDICGGLVVDVDAVDHVKDDEAGGAEGCGLNQAREGDHGPFNDFLGGELLELGVDEFEVGRGEGGREGGDLRGC